jgi:DNA modification methylase
MVKIYNSDCEEQLKEIPDNSVDAIVTDPPYGINITEWDKNIDWFFLFEECCRILKSNGNFISFCGWSTFLVSVSNALSLHTHPDKLEKMIIIETLYFKNWIIWDRIKGRGAKRNFVSTREDIIWMVKSENYTFNKEDSTTKKKTGGMGKKNGSEYRRLSNVWTDISSIVPWSNEKVNHPTQKPIKLMERIIRIFSNKNDIVLDPFMGSGSTGVAAVNLKRKFIGIEKEKEYFEIAKKRIEKAQNTPTLF